MTHSIRSILCAGLFIAACGGSTPPAETPASGASSGASPAEVAAPEAWRDDMPDAEKAAFMKAHVVPGMGPLFQGYDAAKYASFGCATCHGPDGKKPTEFLPKLTFKNNQLTAFAEHPEISKFMAEQVTPKMGEILGKPAFDPATHQGFGCTGCHAVSM